jgi:flagellar basal body-associated protein FliL
MKIIPERGNMDKKKKIWIPQIIAVLMLVIALNPENPYGYYVLLRIVCCGVFGYLAVMAYSQEKKEWTWILWITAFIYNQILEFL